MSDNSYEIDGVTIAPQAGGFYEISHPQMTEPLRERGKEKAEAKAKEVAAALMPDDGSMPPQGALPPVPPAPAPASGQTVPLEEFEKLKAQVAALTDASGNLVRTVQVDDGAEPANQVPASVPRRYEGEMSAKQKKALKAQGIEVTTIVLEENADIPPTGLYLGHNGKGYMIVPGEKVDVPEFLLEVLDHAVMSAPIKDNKSQKVLGYRDRMRYPYRRVE